MRVLVPGQGGITQSQPQGGGNNEILLDGGKYHSIPLISKGAYVDVPSYFYDTHRGRKAINDCVHSKLISLNGTPGYTSVWFKNGNPVYCETDFTAKNVHYSYGASYRPHWFATIGETRWYSVGVVLNRVITKYEISNIWFNCYLWKYIPRRDIWAIIGMTSRCEWLDDEKESFLQYVASAQRGNFPSIPYSVGDLLGGGTVQGVFASANEALDEACDAVRPLCMAVLDNLSANSGNPTSGSSAYDVGRLRIDWDSVPSQNQLKADLCLNEVELTQEGYDPLQLADIQYWRNWLVQHAYLDALQNAPRLNENSISNIVEIVGFIKGLVVDHRIDMPKSLQSAWLSYRYQYSTSRLDAEEAIQFVHRHMDLETLDKGIHCFGSASTDIKGRRVTCRCGLVLTPKELGTLEKIWRSLYTYGLQPNFYTVWDMIPYSFIVDWFIPIGDMASVLDAEAMYMGGENYDISDVCFSLSYSTSHDKYETHQYSRWQSSPLSHFNEFYWLDKPKASNRTLVFRILDTASLFIG